ncbi:MAG: hypothetical protein ACRCXE_03290 [Metamycoplasmataceae bacterium]
MDLKLTKENKQTLIDTANEYFKLQGKDPNTSLNEIVDGLKGGNGDLKSLKAVSDLTGLVAALSYKTLYMEFSDLNRFPSYMRVFDNWSVNVIDQGNSIELPFEVVAGYTTFDITKWLPSDLTQKLGQVARFNFYVVNPTTGKQELAPNSYQFKKDLTITRQEYIPKFKRNSLIEFIGRQAMITDLTHKYFKFDRWATIIQNLTPAKIINGTGKDGFEAVREFFGEVVQAEILSTDYNYDATFEVLQGLNMNDVVVFCSPKFKTLTQVGWVADKFNSQLIRADGTTGQMTINDFKILGNKINIPLNGDQKVTVDNTKPYIADDELIVVSKQLVRKYVMFEESGSAYFVNNTTDFTTLHEWAMLGVVGGEICFKYKNPNLLKMPV